jgi:hypothetical protein
MRLMAASGQDRSSRQPGNAGSGLRGLGARTTQREPAFSAGTGRRESARGRMRRLVLREASHSRALDTITISFGSPFGSPVAP